MLVVSIVLIRKRKIRYLKHMKKVKKIRFNINQSRMIKNHRDNRKISEDAILERYKSVIHWIYKGWQNNHGKDSDVDFYTYFIAAIKYAEYKDRFDRRKDDIQKIEELVQILKDAIVEYKQDYSKLRTYEDQLKEMGIKWK